MALVVGTNSYVDVADATAYLAERLYADAWDGATDAQRAAALVMATRAIDRLRYQGRPAAIDQALAFPRCRTGVSGTAVVTLCDDAVPQAVRDATCEEALALLDRGNSERRRLQADGVTSFSVGTLQESYATGTTGRAAKLPALVSPEARALLAPWLRGAARIR